MTSPLSRYGAHVRRAARSAALLLAAVAGVTCTERHPLSPLDSPEEPSMALASALTVSPANDTTLIGQTITLTVSGNGGKTATWRSSDTTIATVASTGPNTGAVTGRAAGQVTITASASNKSGSATVLVVPVPVRSITVTPSTASVQIGDSAIYTAIPRDSVGQPLTGRAITWTSSDTSIARVSATGVAFARRRGTAQIRATAEGVTGQAPFVVVVPDLTVASLSSADTANVGDTLLVRYALQNSGDAPLADSVIVRVGLRSTTTGDVVAALRRTMARLAAGETRADSVRLSLPATLPGQYTLVVYTDCRDVAGQTDAARLADCLAAPPTAGTITESVETDNSRSWGVALRGSELSASTLSAPDTLATRTSATVSLTITNAGSATPTGFDVSLGLYDVTTSTVVAAATVATPALGSRAARSVSSAIAIPARLDVAHAYQLRAAVDCQNAGTTPIERLQTCIASPAGPGAIVEGNENDNAASRLAIVISNVAKVTALPDTIRFTTLGDTTTLSAVATDRAGLTVGGVVIGWTSLDSAATVSASGTVRAVANGTARIVASAEGKTDTTVVVVAQHAATLVATPDSVVLTTATDTARLTAVVRDASGTVIPAAVVTWTSLDPAVASVSSVGTVRPVASGRARIVAASGTAMDTAVAVIDLRASAVAITPDTALVAVGGVVTLGAELRDASGRPIAGASPSWSTLDPTVATVSDSGRVSGLAAGSARIVATRDARADTAIVLVNPAGYTHRWIGANAMGWDQPANWYPHVVPSSASDSPFIPADVPQRPYIWADAVVGSIQVAAGSSLDLRGHTLTANGTVDVRGSIDSGTVNMYGAGTLGGTLPSVKIHAPVTLAARTAATDLEVADAGRLTINGRTLITPWLGVGGSGSVVEANALDSIIVTNNVSFSGQATTALSAGVLRLEGTFNQYGPAGSFVTSGSHTTVFAGQMSQIVSFSDTTTGFQNLAVVNPQGVQLQNTMSVRGALRLANGGRLTMPNGSLRLLSQLPDVAQGTYDIANTVVAGPITLQRNQRFDGAVFVDGGSLTFNGHTLEARTLNTFDGTLTMSSPADSLVIHETASFYGRERFSAGTLITYGWFNLGYAPSVAGGGFQASGSHTTVFAGSWQTWMIDHPELHRMANVRVLPGANVQLSHDAHVYGRLTVEAGGTLNQGMGEAIHYHVQLPDVTRGSYQVYTSKIAGDIWLDQDVVMPTSTTVVMGDSVRFSLNGHKLDVGAFFTGPTSSQFIMMGLTPAESLIVRDRAYLAGVLQLDGGVIALYGDLQMSGYPSSNAWARPKMSFLGSRPHQISGMYSSDSLLFGSMEVSAGGSVTADKILSLRGALTLGAGSTLDLGQRALRVGALLPDVEQGTLVAGSIAVRGDVVMTADHHYGVPMSIEGGGRVRLNGHLLDLATMLWLNGVSPTQPVIVMDDARDSLVVGQRMYLQGLTQLSAGTLVLRGDLASANISGAFAPSGTHTTVFAGSSTQQLQLPQYAWFNNLKVDNPAA